LAFGFEKEKKEKRNKKEEKEWENSTVVLKISVYKT